jgi:hypothetical protein
VEPHDKEELTKARVTLERQLEILCKGRPFGGDRLIITKLRSQISEITEILEADKPGAPPTVAKAAALREGAVLSENVKAISEKHVA